MSKSTLFSSIILIFSIFIISCKKDIQLTDGQLAEKDVRAFINKNKSKINSLVVYARYPQENYYAVTSGYNYSFSNGFLKFSNSNESFNLAFLKNYELIPCTGYCIGTSPANQLSLYIEPNP